jgi:hypothetical protein
MVFEVSIEYFEFGFMPLLIIMAIGAHRGYKKTSKCA